LKQWNENEKESIGEIRSERERMKKKRRKNEKVKMGNEIK
jgi:hypothetical protein